jgi:hypothetical protein
MLELKGDVHALETSDPAGRAKDPTALPRRSPPGSTEPSLLNAVYTSQIAKDGPNLLLFRPMNGPVFSVSPSGEVRVHKLTVEGDYRLYTIKANGNSWIVEFLHNVPHREAVELSTYAFDRDSGSLLRQYFFAADIGWGLACVDGDEFTYVVADQSTNALKLVKLTPGASGK